LIESVEVVPPGGQLFSRWVLSAAPSYRGIRLQMLAAQGHIASPRLKRSQKLEYHE